MNRPQSFPILEFEILEERRLLSAGSDLFSSVKRQFQTGTGLESSFFANSNVTSAQWVDRAGYEIGDHDIPNRTDIFARLTTDATLPDTIVASIYEDDLFGDDFIADITLNKTKQGSWIGPWQALWSDDGIGVPEYYFELTVGASTVSSPLVTVLQGNAWHAQTAASGSLQVGSTVNVGFVPAEIPAGLRLSQVAVEVDFGNAKFGTAQHEFELVVTGPHAGWNRTIPIPANYDFGQPIEEIFRTAGCDMACPGNDFTTQFLDSGLNNGFYGNWSISAANLETGDVIEVSSYRATLTFFSRLNTSGYDPSFGPDQYYSSNAQREYGYLSDFNNVELTNPNDVTKAVIFVHGWNPGPTGYGDNFQTVYSNFWDSLEPQVHAFADATGNWLVAEYDWVNDAATGSNELINVPLSLARSPLASRDVATAHGGFLGRAIHGISQSLFANVESIQFIGFSAGNWAAMEAADYLRDIGFEGAMQLTSLDAFVSDRQTVFGVTVGIETERIFESGRKGFTQPDDVLDNYWVDDESDALVGWTSGSYGGWDVNRQLDLKGNTAPLFDPMFDVHSGPIGWYAETANYLFNKGNIDLLIENGIPIGFGSSLLFKEWWLATADEIVPDSFSTVRGTHIGGGLFDLWASDNSYLLIQQELSASPTVQIELAGTSPSTSPELLGLRIEASANAIRLLQAIEIFNFDLGIFETLDSRDAALFDSVLEFEFTGDLSRYVESNTSEVRARLTWQDDGSHSLVPWLVGIDQAVWLVRHAEPPNSFQPGFDPPGAWRLVVNQPAIREPWSLRARVVIAKAPIRSVGTDQALIVATTETTPLCLIRFVY